MAWGPKPSDPNKVPRLKDRSLGTHFPRGGYYPTGGAGERHFQHWAPIFLAKLLETGSMATAATAANISLRTMSRYRRLHPDFDEAVMRAMMPADGALEQCTLERAIHGWDEPVYYKGEIVGHIKRFDNNLSMKMLEKRMPSVYGPDNDGNSDEANELAALIVSAVSSMDESIPKLPENGADPEETLEKLAAEPPREAEIIPPTPPKVPKSPKKAKTRSKKRPETPE